MLTEDENIVEIKFAVQYRLSDARAFLFNSRDPEDAVLKAAETAVREVVGKMKMDAALAEERDQIGPRVRALMQSILDRYRVGIEVVGINLQQGGVRPPRTGAGRLRRRAESRPGARARQERGPGLRQRGGAACQGYRVAPDGGGRGLQGAHRRAGRG